MSVPTVACGALPRHPEVVVDHHVNGTALQRHVGRLAAAEALHLEVEAVLGVEPVVLMTSSSQLTVPSRPSLR